MIKKLYIYYSNFHRENSIDLSDSNKSKRSFMNSKDEKKKSKSFKIFEEENLRNIVKLEPECELASSSNSNILEAICLIIEDYKKNFLGRSLVLTGQSIIVITCGEGKINRNSSFFFSFL